MEDLWKVRKIGYRLGDIADRAEYDRLVNRFHREEEKANRENLLFGRIPFCRNTPNDSE
ncbi:hypothetical protein [Desulfuromonas sp.]|uniref:hypothetical protein n=1 Tax=Desulfuromonas sp. TaxID=892 RepID=UPI0025C5C5D9|nr:hypothetical protein [Desulfuromonas sp.]